ncbi:MAG: uncharacterized protein KVP18_002360 [Porospora cf. gigantea A]|uniref:uncharacterized protein n=1 Tax=Porospora cf. gigantea A TaxID=2853593 RepID=UPI00355A321B|nr:MAG: hypothetical protein KVP18_002360 [Porospora cf. gigantea A]
MSHRKFERPRHGSLAFLPRRRCTLGRARVKTFPPDEAKDPCHLTCFAAYKAGMTHVVRELERPGSKLHQKDIVNSVTIVDAPPMVCVGFVGYVETPKGLRPLTAVWAGQLSEECKRRFYKSWYRAKKHKAFTLYSQKYQAGKMECEIEKVKKYCSVVRALCHTQIGKIPGPQKKAHILEVQVNGGSTTEKVDYCLKLFEQTVPVASVFAESENVDVVGISKGHGCEGVVHRWGVTRLPRKTHRGLRKVACIGSWHPARVGFQVARAGQNGFHHRTEKNKKIFRIGAAEDPRSGSTNHDITEKKVTPMGGFVNYGDVNNDFLMLKGGIVGPRRRLVILRKALSPQVSRRALEPVNLKFIDTASKRGIGRFQTSAEKAAFFGRM